MKAIVRLSVLPFVIVAFGCAKDAPVTSTELSADLRKDLELAAASGLDLASARAGAGQQVVSAIEAPQSAPVNRAPAPRRARTPKASPLPDAQMAPEPELAEVPQPEPTAEIQVAATAEPPVAAPRPSAPPVVYPAGNRGPGGGGITIIRGGSAGVDHCERHGVGRGGVIGTAVGIGIGIAVNDRGPRIGIGNTTFPRY